MRLNKDGKEYCAASVLGEFWHERADGIPGDREIRYVIAVDRSVEMPGVNEFPKPVWEFETRALRQRVLMRRGTMPDEMKVVVVFAP
jgi:hypothetical protein